MSRIVHFELPTTDAAASRKFYENVFGWKLMKYDGPVEYWLVTTGEAGTPGIDGGLGGAANELKGTVNTVDVEDIDATLRLIEANGGQIVAPKDEIPGVGWLAYIKEPGGAMLGVIQTHPHPAM